jgi:predicted ATPase/DNA-binding winged helix-turn-helix (wHTH) protein
MESTHEVRFGPFRLDAWQGRLWRGDRQIALRPRALAVLRYLAAHPGRPVPKAELAQQVWGGVHVSSTVLRVCIRDIRAALGDDASAPQYVETVGQEGYRFVGGADDIGPTVARARPVVGRQREVAALQRLYAMAAGGGRQLVLLSGEAGIGKTTVVDVWLTQLASWGGVRVGRGQCVEHYGESEPYLPVLEVLGSLGRRPGGERLVAVLRRQAPLWLVQLPAIVPEAEWEALQRRVQGATPTRMLRELADAVEAYAAEAPLVMVLEDLHWSDTATVELLAYLAQRREPARLLLIGTYRPVDAVVRGHPIRGMIQELRGRGLCTELTLELLTAADVAAYVAGCLGGPIAADLAERVYRHTEGNALFMVNVLEDLWQRGLLAQVDGQWTLREDATRALILPQRLQSLLLRRLEALPELTQRVLEAAAVQGEAFAAAAVAAAVQQPVDLVEAVCERLGIDGQLVAPAGLVRWPDGTVSGSYRFQHTLYQNLLYEHVGEVRRLHLHARLGRRLEDGYGAQAGEIAAQLAVHFEGGGETQRAVHYWQQAAENAVRRNAHPEGLAALRKGLALLATLPDGGERTRQELTLQLALGELLMAAKGMASLEAGEAYSRARTLCDRVREVPQLFRTLWGFILFHFARAQFQTAGELGQELFHLAQRQHDADFLALAHVVMGMNAFFHGDLVAARTNLERCLPLCDTQQLSAAQFISRYERGAKHGTWFAQVLWGLGYADQAQQQSQEALALARQSGHASILAYAEFFATMLTQYRRAVAATYARAEALMALAAAQGFELRLEQGRMLRGWALAMQGKAAEGVAQIRQGWAAQRAVGPKLLQPYFLALLAEASGQAGAPEAGLPILAEAMTLVDTTEERWWEAELYRLQAELLLQLPTYDVHKAESLLHHSLDVARAQQAKALELRAALSLSRLWQRQGKCDAARQLLAEVYGWFTEGFGTVDLHEARVLLEEIS